MITSTTAAFDFSKVPRSRTSRKMTFQLFILVAFVLANIDNFASAFLPRSVSIRSTKISSEKLSNYVLEANGRLSTTSLNTNPRKIDVPDGTINAIGDLSKHNLLTGSDEMELSRQFKLGLSIKKQEDRLEKLLGRQVTDVEIARSLDVEPKQVKILLNKGDVAKQVLIKANMRLVLHIARYYKFRGIAYPDLVQEGTFGLMKAVEKYDPERGYRFSTYATWWIKQSVSRAVAEKSRIVRLPVHIHDLMVSLAKADKQFQEENSRKPSSHELAERLGLPVQKIELLLKCGRDVNSMDEKAFKNRGKLGENLLEVKDRIESENVAPTVLNTKNSLRAELRRSMTELSEREAQIVEMRFGLADGNFMTLEEIGKRFNVTRERIRQIEARALSKMRHPIRTHELKEIISEHSAEAAVAAAMSSSSSSMDSHTAMKNKKMLKLRLVA